MSVKLESKEIYGNVLKIIEPDLKILKTMNNVWTLLEREYGLVYELMNELIWELAQFSVR